MHCTQFYVDNVDREKFPDANSKLKCTIEVNA